MSKLTVFRLMYDNELRFSVQRFYTTETTCQLFYGESSSWVSVYYPALVDLLAENDQAKAVRVLMDFLLDRPVLYFNHILQQECIPVGSLLSAAVAVCLVGGSLPGGICPGGVCPGGVCLGVSAPGVSAWGYLPRGCLPGVICPGGVCLGVSVQVGVCLGVSAEGGVCPWGVCPRGFLPKRNVSAQGGVCPGTVCPGGCLADTPLWTE